MSQPSPAAVEQALLGERRRYNRREVCDLAGMTVEQAQRFWRAMGFPGVDDRERVFTDADVAALAGVRALVDNGAFDQDLALSVTRALGRNLARVSDWLGEAFADHLRRRDGLDDDAAAAAAAEAAADLLPELEELVVYVWRRQLAATASRALAAASGEASAGRLAVGFADLVGYTRLSRQLDERDLAAMVEGFEALASDVVTGVGGRVVKTVGDEVLFVADTPGQGAEIGLRLAEEMARVDSLPDVRVGLAEGTVLSRLGDVFGTTVNRASRLTAQASPGGVLADEALGDAVAALPQFRVERLWRRSLPGLGMVRPVRLTRVRPVGSGA